MSFLCLSSDTIQCNNYRWRASHQQHTVWKCFLESLSLNGSRWHVRQGLFLYHNPVPPNSNSFKILFQTWPSLRHHFNSLILVIICTEAPAKLCYVLCVYLEAFLLPWSRAILLHDCFRNSPAQWAVAVPSSSPPLLSIFQKYFLKALLNFSEFENPYAGPRLHVL